MSDRFCFQFIRNEHGGVHVLLLGLLAIGAVTAIAVTGVNAALHYASRNSLKPVLDAATHAASLDIDRVEASFGRLVWDQPKGTTSFQTVLYRNLHLDAAGVPQAGSPLPAPPVVHVLSFVTNVSYPYDYSYSVTLYPGTQKETIRNVHARLYGPSVVAIVEFAQRQFGGNGFEPIVLSSVSSIRPRY